MRGAEALSSYAPISEHEKFRIEYWSLEEAKLRRLPPERELDRQGVVVIGAGAGIGKAASHRLVKEGAHLVCVDRDQAAALATAQEMVSKYGEGIGVAGTGLSRCGPAIGLPCNVTDRDSVQRMLSDAVLAYGGLDAVAVTAGVFVPPDRAGHNTDEQWRLTLDINVTANYLLADEAQRFLKEQQLPAALVLTSSANAVVPKLGSEAYDVSKAAINHLIRELAVGFGPLVRVNGIAPATVVAGSAMFPRDRVVASLQKYRIPHSDDESTEALRSKLADFYAQRTITRRPILPEDCARAICWLASEQSGKTTGHVIPVDGGLPDAFLR